MAFLWKGSRLRLRGKDRSIIGDRLISERDTSFYIAPLLARASLSSRSLGQRWRTHLAARLFRVPAEKPYCMHARHTFAIRADRHVVVVLASARKSEPSERADDGSHGTVTRTGLERGHGDPVISSHRRAFFFRGLRRIRGPNHCHPAPACATPSSAAAFLNG